ncbi:MAG TPA: hypothetical protein VN780_02805 [Candidatus Eisenbacteria bacterium]|nr:hypothetical protein [Candidatus Eisenbacteria bacterium]
MPVRMLVQTFRAYVGLGLFLAMGISPVQAKEGVEARSAITVSVYDDARVGLEGLQQMEQISSEVFSRVGIEIRWLNCGVNGELTHVSGECGQARFPEMLQLRFLQKPRDLNPGTFGISYLNAGGEGCYSQVFVEPIEQLRQQFPIGLSTLLGYVATHELAHLLLGTNSHTAFGIMRARWGPKELESANMGGLRFYEEQRERMATRVAAGIRHNQQMLAATASRCNVAAD